MSRMIPPICLWCKHYKDNGFGKEFKPTCDAFPDGIPLKIWNDEVIHREPYEGDNGILFEMQESYDDLPEILKLILEGSTLPFDEILDWIINFIEEGQKRRQELLEKYPSLKPIDRTGYEEA